MLAADSQLLLRCSTQWKAHLVVPGITAGRSLTGAQRRRVLLPVGMPRTARLWDCLGAARQLWWFEQIPGPYDYKLRNLQTGQCIDVPGGNPVAGVALQQWPCNGTTAQQW